jgi:hypothetical protein
VEGVNALPLPHSLPSSSLAEPEAQQGPGLVLLLFLFLSLFLLAAAVAADVSPAGDEHSFHLNFEFVSGFHPSQYLDDSGAPAQTAAKNRTTVISERYGGRVGFRVSDFPIFLLACRHHAKTFFPSAMTDTSIQVPALQRFWRFFLRLAIFLLLAFTIGAVLNRISSTLERDARPAGFSRGVLQGALMPMALPNLLVGRDVAIYAVKNTGLHYKLGYTAGVNSCGAIFFGFVFWRITRWRKRPAN